MVLEIHDPNAADKRKKFLLARKNYDLATDLNKKAEGVQVVTLLTVIYMRQHGKRIPRLLNWAKRARNRKSKFRVLCKVG